MLLVPKFGFERGFRCFWPSLGRGRGLVLPTLTKVLWLNDESVANTRCAALERLLLAMDRLVMGCLSQHVDSLSNIDERTDAMLAVYPGGAARFTMAS